MYAALWRLLPGGRWLQTLQMVLLAAAVIAVLFVWVFPTVAPHLPIEQVTLDAPADRSTVVPTGAST